MEHRLIMGHFLGRKLRPDELVHHIDGNKANNSWDNLQLMTRSQHAASHYPEKREKIREAVFGSKHSPETKAKMRQAWFASEHSRTHLKEITEKARLSNLGAKRSLISRERMRKSATGRRLINGHWIRL